MSLILTTDSVEPKERLAYCNDMICATYVQPETDAVQSDEFCGSIVTHSLPGMELSVVKSSAQKVLRTPRVISRSTDDCFIVSLQTQGQAVISQDGRDAHMSPGDCCVYDSTRPYTLRCGSGFEEIVLKFRRDRIHALLGGTELLTATTVQGHTGAGRVLFSLIHTLLNEVDRLRPAAAAAVANGVVNVLVAGLQSLPACRKAELSNLNAYHVARIRQYMDEHVRDPSLTIEMIAAHLGMSCGHLHRVFKNEAMSPSQYLWSQRLDACSRELIDLRKANLSVAAIAFSWGFNDAAHFSRAFRERFHCSPREWRRQAAAMALAQEHRSDGERGQG